MLSKLRKKKRKPVSEINVVPYIDVMLVLLIIFMITAPILTRGVDVDLPKVDSKTMSQEDKEPIVVSVDVSGNYYLNIAKNPSEPISVPLLQNQIEQELLNGGAQQRPVLVRGDRNVNYGKIVEAMVMLKDAGAKGVGLITEMPREVVSRN